MIRTKMWRKNRTTPFFVMLACVGLILSLIYRAAIQTASSQIGAIRTATRNAVLYRFHGKISGTVRFANGKPASGFRVVARFIRRSTGAVGWGYAITDTSGHYSIGGLTDRQVRNHTDFAVEVHNEGKPFLATVPAKPVTLTTSKNRINGVDFVLEPGPEVTVRVRDAETDKPVADLPVLANRAEWSTTETVGTTNASGQFLYKSPTRRVELRIGLPKAKRPVIGPAPGYSFFHGVELKPGQKVTWDVKTYENPFRSATRTLCGTLFDENGKPLSGAVVQLLRRTHNRPLIQRVITGPKGAFQFRTTRVSQYARPNSIALIFDHGGQRMVFYVRATDSWKPLSVRFEPTHATTLPNI